MTPFWEDDHLTLYGGDCRVVLASMPAESVHCVVTSPPYWGLRDYGTATWDGGDPVCDHTVNVPPSTSKSSTLAPHRPPMTVTGNQENAEWSRRQPRATCRKCGARRIDSQLGLEPTPEEYVANMVAVFREVRRVLRNDGTLWLNLGDSYAASGAGNNGNEGYADGRSNRAARLGGRGVATLKPKDLVGIPWRVAFALQADGWYLRSDIIWSKPNPMPESVTDRPTKAHEYLFLLSKAPRYYFDSEAVRETVTSDASIARNRSTPRQILGAGARQPGGNDAYHLRENRTDAGRNLRSVWNIATEPYPGAHFATFPRKLVEPCVKAGTSERGVCPECGAPWERVVERPEPTLAAKKGPKGEQYGTSDVPTTTGWRPTCIHGEYVVMTDGAPQTDKWTPVPATVLDPFAGSGTTLLVAQSLGRRGVGIDLNPDYLKQALTRNAQTPLGLVG